MDEEQQDQTDLMQKPEDKQCGTSISRTLISLGLFIAVYYMLFKSWMAVLVLVAVLIIHELGHFIAMKYYGYKSVNMTFVPFIGAYVSGRASDLSRKNKLVVVLAGPIPGVIIGCILLCLHTINGNDLYFRAAITFVLLNVINLLPILPLDGGQFFQTFFFNASRIIQLLFLYVSLAVLLYMFVKLNYSFPLLLIAGLILLRINSIHFNNRVRRRLDEEGIDHACSYDDLTEEEYWAIRKTVITQSSYLGKKFDVDIAGDNERQMIRYVENVLVPAYDDDLSKTNKIIFIMIWAAGFAIPLIQLSISYKGYWERLIG